MSDGYQTIVTIMPWVGPVLAFVSLGYAIRAGRRHRLVNCLPTSKTTGVFIGLVELKGTAEAEAPLTSYLAESHCVWYSWSVEEHWSRTVTETYTDSDGRTQTRTRTESGWTTVASGQQDIPFYLQDDEGIILVLPDGAEVQPDTVFDETCTPLNSLYYGKGPAFGVPDSTFCRRFIERAIPLHAQLYIMGQARERSDIVAAEIAADPAATMFLISTKSEEEVSSGFRHTFWGLSTLGLLLSDVSVWAGEASHQLSQNNSVIFFVLAAVAYLAIALVCWSIMVFNSLIDLRQRVRQGWSQVDVQLKRRHDLINNLINAVKGFRDYENNLQTELAELRSQLTATAPGVEGPEFRGVRNVVVAMAERYPNLTAQESFANLQQNLINTEQRIALARSYFNEIASHYNARLEIIPDRFLATVARLQPQALLVAEDFERAPVEVKLAQ